MQKRTITLALISIAIVVVALFASLYYSGFIGGSQVTYQLPDGEPESWQIKVSGDFEEEKTVSLKELTQMQLTSANVMLEGDAAAIATAATPVISFPIFITLSPSVIRACRAWVQSQGVATIV